MAPDIEHPFALEELAGAFFVPLYFEVPILLGEDLQARVLLAQAHRLLLLGE